MYACAAYPLPSLCVMTSYPQHLKGLTHNLALSAFTRSFSSSNFLRTPAFHSSSSACRWGACSDTNQNHCRKLSEVCI